MSQSDTRVGALRVLAGGGLTGKEGFLVKMAEDSGVPEVLLPTSNGDLALYVVENGDEDGEYVDVIPLSAGVNARLTLKGTCVPGDVLVLADTATPADCGKVRVLPETPGTYRGIAIAEETGIEGQLVLCRPALIGVMTVAE